MDTKVKIVQGVYDAFGRGDVPAILDVVTNDVDWASEAESTVAPWHGVRRGKAELSCPVSSPRSARPSTSRSSPRSRSRPARPT